MAVVCHQHFSPEKSSIPLYSSLQRRRIWEANSVKLNRGRLRRVKRHEGVGVRLEGKRGGGGEERKMSW